MDPPPALRNKILLVPMKIPDSLLSGDQSHVSKKPDTYNKRLECTKPKWQIIHITKSLFTVQKTLGYCGPIPQVYSSISCHIFKIFCLY